MTYEPAADRMDISRLANEALALAARLPGQPSRVKMRSGTCEIEIEWPASGELSAQEQAAHGLIAGDRADSNSAPSDLAGFRTGRHRRPGEDEGDDRNFSLLTG
jgi:hypothetical protein